MNFGAPRRTAAAWVKTLVATWVFAILVSKMQYFHWFFKVLQNRAGVPAGKKSTKVDFLPNNQHDNVTQIYVCMDLWRGLLYKESPNTPAVA